MIKILDIHNSLHILETVCKIVPDNYYVIAYFKEENSELFMRCRDKDHALRCLQAIFDSESNKIDFNEVE